ncbi:MAG: hypothetical protein H0V44_09170 [Planctomycetes bacterium]|nr:hypothetical protein [Planctomycetota bacterium]
MNVYFCDSCGVRVTDVDLHSGHGMRRRNDVICATCIDLGHGKDWMQKGQAPVLAAVGAGVAEDADQQRAAQRPSSPIIAVARDRARTVEEEEEPAAVAPVVMRADLSAHVVEGVPDLDDDSATAKVPILHQNLASTAAGFAALGQPVDESRSSDDDDLEETPVPQKPDDTGAESILAPTAAPAPGVSPFESSKDAPDTDREKEETRIPSSPDTEIAHKSSDRLSKSQKSARGKTSASRAGKPGKSTSRRGKSSNQQILIMSAVTGVLILIIGVLVIVKASNRGPRTPQTIVEDLTKKIRTEVKAAATTAKAALQSKDPAALQDARTKLMALQADVNTFNIAAQKASWSEDNVETFLERDVHYQDVKTMLRLVNDELVKQRK